MDYGAILRAVRIGKGLSIIELAEKSGVHPNTISNWERGKSQPSIYGYEACLKVCGFKLELEKENKK